jgi:hypothetical protein
MTERKEDTTTIIEPDDLLLKFKRSGHFDRQRKHLYESFVNSVTFHNRLALNDHS